MAGARTTTPQPQLNTQSTKGLNLAVLQRTDPDVEDILGNAGHVTVYEFDIDEKIWSRKDVEGSLFVVKRRSQPRFQFIVMNRKSTKNLVEDLLADFEFEIQMPYMLYRNAEQEVNGIWFYNQRECDDIAKLLTRILSAFNKTPPKPKAFVTPASSPYQELEPRAIEATVSGPLEPDVEEAQAVGTPQEDQLERFFTRAINVGQVEDPSTSAIAAAHVPSAPPLLLSRNSTSPAPLPPLAPQSAPTVTIDALEVVETTTTQLIKPSFFAPPANQHATPPAQGHFSHGTPFLQPFPPPNPPASLQPTSHHVAITKERVRAALTRLVQDERFIDLVYQEIQEAHTT